MNNIFLMAISFVHRSHGFTFEEYINQKFKSQLQDHIPDGFNVKSANWVNDELVSSLINLELNDHRSTIMELDNNMSISTGYIHIQIEGSEGLERQKLDWLHWVYSHVFTEISYSCSYSYYLVNENDALRFEIISGNNTPQSSSEEDDYIPGIIQDFAELMNHHFYGKGNSDQFSDQLAKLYLLKDAV